MATSRLSPASFFSGVEAALQLVQMTDDQAEADPTHKENEPIICPVCGEVAG